MQVQRRTSVTCGNSVIEKRVLDNQKRKLAEILRKMKPVIDTSAPPVRPHVNTQIRHSSVHKKRLSRSQSEDSKMVDAILRTMNRAFVLPTPVDVPSLNITQRREELRSITDANWKLLGRLEAAHSQYSRKTMEEEYMRNQRYVFNASFSTRKKYEELVRQHKLLEEKKCLEVSDEKELLNSNPI